MPNQSRFHPRRAMWPAVAVLTAALGWVLLQESGTVAPAPAPAPTAPEAEADPVEAAAPAELPELPGEGPVVVELRYLGADATADGLVERRGELRGRVLDDGGQPRPGARLTVRGGPQDGLSVTADDAGRYRFLGLLPGTHLVDLEAGGFRASASQRVLARAPTERDFVVGMPAPLLIEVRGADGEPLAGATVDVGLGRELLETGEDGRAFFPAVPRGPRVLVGARAADHVPLRLEMNLLPRNPGGEPVRIDLPRGGRVRGRVASWPGAPLPTVTVVPREDRPSSYAVAWDTWHEVEVQPDGRFELSGLPTTRVIDVRVFHPRGVAEPALRTVKPGPETPTTVRFNIRRRDTRIAGQVVDEQGRGVAGALVVLEAADPAAVLGRLYPGLAEGPVAAVLPTPAALRREWLTPSDGRFDFDYGDHPQGSGPLVLRASKEGYAPASSLVRNARSNFSLRLAPVGRDGEVRLRARNGKALPEVVWYLDGARAEAAGERFGPLLEGHYEVRVRRGEAELQPREVLLVAPRLELELG